MALATSRKWEGLRTCWGVNGAAIGHKREHEDTVGVLGVRSLACACCTGDGVVEPAGRGVRPGVIGPDGNDNVCNVSVIV
jgi:hypothetical protein